MIIGEDSRWALQIALPFDRPRLRVEGDQFAVDEGDVEQPFVVGGGGDVGRLAPVLRITFPFPEDLVVIERDRVQVPELVDDIGDAVGDGRRELDQAVGVDRPVFAQGRVELALVGRQVLGPFRHPAEGRPVDEIRPGRVRAVVALFIAATAAGAQAHDRQGRREGCEAPNSDASAHPPPHRHEQCRLDRLPSRAADGNRTRIIALEGRGSTVELPPRARQFAGSKTAPSLNSGCVRMCPATGSGAVW